MGGFADTPGNVTRWMFGVGVGREKGKRNKGKGKRERGKGKTGGTAVPPETGVLDRLCELRYNTKGLNGSRGPKGGSRRAQHVLDLRAQRLWNLWESLEGGKIALPPDDELANKLCAIRWTVTSAGELWIEAKDELPNRLGRSPDRADAVAMALQSGT